MPNIKRTEWGTEVNIDEIDDLTRAVALTICVGQGFPWWNFLAQARQILYIVEEHGGTVVYPR